MLTNDTLGVYLPDSKTYYYLESGEIPIFNTVDRIKKALIQRNLIKVNYSSTTSSQSYSILKYSDLKRNYDNFSISPIFISKHMEKLYNAKTTNESSSYFKS